jgi:hypothetical protein
LHFARQAAARAQWPLPHTRQRSLAPTALLYTPRDANRLGSALARSRNPERTLVSASRREPQLDRWLRA